MCFNSDGIDPSLMVLFMSSERGSAKASAPSLRRRNGILVKPEDFVVLIAPSFLWRKSLEINVSLKFASRSKSPTGRWEIKGHGVDGGACRSLAFIELKNVPNPADIHAGPVMSSLSIIRDWTWLLQTCVDIADLIAFLSFLESFLFSSIRLEW